MKQGTTVRGIAKNLVSFGKVLIKFRILGIIFKYLILIFIVLIKQDENDDNASNTAISQQSPSNRMLQATLEEAQKARKPSYKTNYKSATKKETSAIFQLVFVNE